MTKIMTWILGIAGALIAALLLIACILLGREWNRMTFFEQTSINGFDVSGKTPEEVLPVLKEEYSKAQVHLTENGKDEAVWSLADVGFTVDETALEAGLKDAHGKQKSSIPVLLDSLMNGNSFELDVPFRYDAQKLSQTVSTSAMADERIQNVDAEITYDQEAKNYAIKPEVQGTMLNDSDIQQLVQQAVENAVGGSKPQTQIDAVIPASLYIVPSILSTDPTLNLKVNTFNSYDKAVITYVFGEEKEVLDWNTICDWVVFENGEGYLSEERIREYVMTLGQKYNTIYYERSFHTTGGSDITFSENDNNYGYLIDEEGEYAQLLADIQSNTQTEREPIYAYAGVGRHGRDDMASYVEVSIGAQHLWFYKDYQLLYETDVVTGCIAKNTPTQTGIFPIAYKESPATLIPSNETNGTPVKYWMPFYDGQGLHDANWRSAFGGNIYQTSGSHGCVNMPYPAAEFIFNNADTGTPVVLY